MTDAPARTWRTVLQHVEQRLIDGELGPGDRLPSERDLAAELGVGRSSVREAIRVLEVMGLIRTSTGSGPQAGAIVIAAPGGGLSALLRLQVAAQGFPIADVVGTRLILEQAVVRALAGGEGDTAEVHRLLDAMDADLNAADFLALDAQLHLALAEASGNAVVAAMMTGLRDSIESYVRTGSAGIQDWEGMAARLRAEHRDIVRAIDEGRADAATALVRDHITGYYAATGLAGAGATTP
ncbi:MAG: GntR family transcriptional regulator [Microbacterium sp.]|jgi:DNA-binding FadR family transcriptional regulator|uniref:FadR/GntR family transcriptional regulator n=1 Tax=Microbacterium sp. TaxID=51671 RepID=UPI00282EA288|nr:FCD domain-containing protein [Microbacterium sp.]MDR2323484.1 GntR family transcriptional regulator [Microbacterium sp.]